MSHIISDVTGAIGGLFGSKQSASPPPVPAAPTLSQAQIDANITQQKILSAGAIGNQQTILTQNLQSAQTKRGATLLGGSD
jgi:hypothetical protein